MVGDAGCYGLGRGGRWVGRVVRTSLDTVVVAMHEGRRAEVTRRVCCVCGRFLANVQRTPTRLELARCRCGWWPIVEVDCEGAVTLVFREKRNDSNQA